MIQPLWSSKISPVNLKPLAEWLPDSFVAGTSCLGLKLKWPGPIVITSVFLARGENKGGGKMEGVEKSFIPFVNTLFTVMRPCFILQPLLNHHVSTARISREY